MEITIIKKINMHSIQPLNHSQTTYTYTSITKNKEIEKFSIQDMELNSVTHAHTKQYTITCMHY